MNVKRRYQPVKFLHLKFLTFLSIHKIRKNHATCLLSKLFSQPTRYVLRNFNIIHKKFWTNISKTNKYLFFLIREKIYKNLKYYTGCTVIILHLLKVFDTYVHIFIKIH